MFKVFSFYDNESLFLLFLIKFTVEKHDHKNNRPKYGCEHRSIVWVRCQQEPLELIVSLGPQGYSLCKFDEVEAGFFVDDLELVDSFLSRGVELSVIPGFPLDMVQLGVDPRIEHYKLNH